MRFKALTALLLIGLPSQSLEAQPNRLCWIKKVTSSDQSVRVFFEPEVVGSVASEQGVTVKLDRQFSPVDSGHEGCTVKAVRRSSLMGVNVEQYAYAPGLMAKPTVRRGWIAAEPVSSVDSRAHAKDRACSDGTQCRTGSCIRPARAPLTYKKAIGICSATHLPVAGICGQMIVRSGSIIVPACH
jgi:hypothetical protein